MEVEKERVRAINKFPKRTEQSVKVLYTRIQKLYNDELPDD
jgi:hypothetical protein